MKVIYQKTKTLHTRDNGRSADAIAPNFIYGCLGDFGSIEQRAFHSAQKINKDKEIREEPDELETDSLEEAAKRSYEDNKSASAYGIFSIKEQNNRQLYSEGYANGYKANPAKYSKQDIIDMLSDFTDDAPGFYIKKEIMKILEKKS